MAWRAETAGKGEKGKHDVISYVSEDLANVFC